MSSEQDDKKTSSQQFASFYADANSPFFTNHEQSTKITDKKSIKNKGSNSTYKKQKESKTKMENEKSIKVHKEFQTSIIGQPISSKISKSEGNLLEFDPYETPDQSQSSQNSSSSLDKLDKEEKRNKNDKLVHRASIIKSSDVKRRSASESNLLSQFTIKRKSSSSNTKKRDETSKFSFNRFHNTLGRRNKKKKEELDAVIIEGRKAIEDKFKIPQTILKEEFYKMKDGETRTFLQNNQRENTISSNSNININDLRSVLKSWINTELSDQRFIVENLEEDLHDGHLLHKLIEKLSGIRLDVPLVTQSEDGKKQKLRSVLSEINRILKNDSRLNDNDKSESDDFVQWNAENIHDRCTISIVRLLIALIQHYKICYVPLPERIRINVIRVTKQNNQLAYEIVQEQLTTTVLSENQCDINEDIGSDDSAFDDNVISNYIVELRKFYSNHLKRFGIKLNDNIELQFFDGVLLILLIGSFENYFVRFDSFIQQPINYQQRLHNVKLAYEFMIDAGFSKPILPKPEQIANKNSKSTLTLLYQIFQKYKHLA